LPYVLRIRFFLIATFIFVGVNTLSARAEKLRGFVDICIDSSSVELRKSDIPGAASYPVRTILGTKQFIDTPRPEGARILAWVSRTYLCFVATFIVELVLSPSVNFGVPHRI